MKLFNFKKKEPVVEEKKPVSITQMKIKYGMFSKKADEIIKKHNAMIAKKLETATEKKMKGFNATAEIKAIARYQSQIAFYEKRKYMLESLIDSVEEAELQKEFLHALGDMVSIFSAASVDMDEFSKINDQIVEETLKLGDQQRVLDGKMDELDAAIDSYDNINGSDLSNVESSINAIIDRTIQDAQLSTGSASAQEVARSVKSKLNIEE